MFGTTWTNTKASSHAAQVLSLPNSSLVSVDAVSTWHSTRKWTRSGHVSPDSRVLRHLHPTEKKPEHHTKRGDKRLSLALHFGWIALVWPIDREGSSFAAAWRGARAAHHAKKAPHHLAKFVYEDQRSHGPSKNSTLPMREFVSYYRAWLFAIPLYGI